MTPVSRHFVTFSQFVSAFTHPFSIFTHHLGSSRPCNNEGLPPSLADSVFLASTRLPPPVYFLCSFFTNRCLHIPVVCSPPSPLVWPLPSARSTLFLHHPPSAYSYTPRVSSLQYTCSLTESITRHVQRDGETKGLPSLWRCGLWPTLVWPGGYCPRLFLYRQMARTHRIWIYQQTYSECSCHPFTGNCCLQPCASRSLNLEKDPHPRLHSRRRGLQILNTLYLSVYQGQRKQQFRWHHCFRNITWTKMSYNEIDSCCIHWYISSKRFWDLMHQAGLTRLGE